MSISLWVKMIYHVRCNGVPKSIDLRNTHPRSLWWFPSILWRPQPSSWGCWRTSKSRSFPCKVPSVSHRPWQAGAAGPGRRGGHHSPQEGAPCVPLAFLQIRLCCPSCMVLLLFLSKSLNIQNGFASLNTVLKSFLKDLVFLLQAIYAWLSAGQNGAVVRAVSGRPPPYQAKQAEQEQLFVLTQVLVSTVLCTQDIMHDNL